MRDTGVDRVSGVDFTLRECFSVEGAYSFAIVMTIGRFGNQ